MFRKADSLREPADTLDGQLEQVGIHGGQEGDEYKTLVAEQAGLLVKLDDFKRPAYVAAKLRQLGYRLSPPPVCMCGQRLTVVRGTPGRIAAHFRHADGKACPGGMSPWHAGMQRGAVAVGCEVEYLLEHSGRRLDAFHPGNGLCIEFVNSMSREYQRKHLELAADIAAGYGPVRGVAWVFNSGARFATRAGEETVDEGAIRRGVVRVGQLFREEKGVRELIKAIGERHCFTIYRGAMFGCIGCDLWECLPESHALQWMCQHEYGLNFHLFAQGKDGVGGVVRTRYPLPSGRVDIAGLAFDMKRELETGKLAKASALQYGISVTPDAAGERDVVSDKSPGENDPGDCEEQEPRPSPNLSAAQVREQLEASRGKYDGSEMPQWTNDRECGQVPEAWEPPQPPQEDADDDHDCEDEYEDEYEDCDDEDYEDADDDEPAEDLNDQQAATSPPASTPQPPAAAPQPVVVTVTPRAPGVTVDATPTPQPARSGSAVPVYVVSAEWVEYPSGHALRLTLRTPGGVDHVDTIWNDSPVLLNLAAAAEVDVMDIRRDPRTVVAMKLGAEFGHSARGWYGVTKFHKRSAVTV